MTFYVFLSCCTRFPEQWSRVTGVPSRVGSRVNVTDPVPSLDQVIARVHSVHLVNVEQRQMAADSQTKPHELGCESACFRQLASTTTIAIYYYYSARKLILIYRPMEGGRLS